MLRSFQSQFDGMCKEIAAGVPVKEVFVAVTPGGGKSLLPVIAAHRLLPKVADAICWVVPRLALREQAEKQFIKPEYRAMIGHHNEISVAGNVYNPTRGRSGYVTTYQSLVADSASMQRQEFDTKRYILFLDEPHHCDEGGEWDRATRPLIERAVLTVYMSGTWERGDGRRIAHLPYEYVGKGKYRPALSLENTTPTTPYIQYSRTQALRDRAIKPLHFAVVDGALRWLDRAGAEQSVDGLASVDDDEAPNAIYTALRTEFAFHLLARCAGDWKQYRMHRRSGKLLVVAPRIDVAKTYVKRLKEMGITDAEIAASDDSEAAVATIERFSRACSKPGALDVLVTVAMAYEGLDVEAITHLACLTHVRSRPWIEQMLARAVRVDAEGGSYDEQVGRIYCPDDRLLMECVDKIREEQESVVRDSRERDIDQDTARVDDGELTRVMGNVIPLAGQVARERAFDLATGQSIDHGETALLLSCISENGLAGLLDPIVLKRTMDSFHMRKACGEAVTPDMPPLPDTPGSRRERLLRKSIATYTGRFESNTGVAFGTLNSEILRQFKTARDEMTEEQLKRVWEWLHDLYPLPR